MIALYLLAAHMVGDFVFQNRWMARGKLENWDTRLLHVVTYVVPFVPVALVYGRFFADPNRWYWIDGHGSAVAFLLWLGVLHFATDSRRFRSTLGDWVGWKVMHPEAKADELERRELRRLSPAEYHSAPTLIRLRPSAEAAARAKVPPNEWEPTPIMVDQALHLCQLAILGGLFLR